MAIDRTDSVKTPVSVNMCTWKNFNEIYILKSESKTVPFTYIYITANLNIEAILLHYR